MSYQKMGDVLRKILCLTSLLLLSGNPSFSAGSPMLETLDKAELLTRLGTHVPRIVSGYSDLATRAHLCNYYEHVFNDERSFDEKVLDLQSSQTYIMYKQCCSTIGFPQVGVLSDSLAGEDPLPTLPELRSRQIRQTETVLHWLIQDRDFAPLMNDITEQIQETVKEVDRVACVPLAATYELIKPDSAP